MVTQREDGKMHMTPRYSTPPEVINICPIALTKRRRKVERKEEKGGGGTRAKDKERSPLGFGLWRHLSYFLALLQTEPLNTLTEQQQRLFKTPRYLGAGSVFSVWPKG